MTTKLFTSRICPFAQRVEIVATMKGFKGERVHMSLEEDMPEWYTKDINPRAEVPAIQLPDGTCFSESALIAQYFDDTLEPKNQLFPPNAEIRRQILAFNEIANGMIWAGYTALMATGDDLTKTTKEYAETVEKVVKAMSTTSPYAVGNSFSFADVYLIPFVVRFATLLSAYNDFNLVKEFPRISQFLDACLAIPAVATTSASAEYFILGYGGYTKSKKATWDYHLYSNALCPYGERVRLTIAQIKRAKPEVAPFFSYEEVGLGEAMPEAFKRDVNPAGELPVLKLPSGALIASSANAVQYLADQFGGDVEGLVPADAAKLLAGRFFVDSAMRVFDELGPHFEKRERGFELSGDVASELRNAERVYAGAGPAGKTYLFGDAPSCFDLLVLPFVHRAELLLGADKLASFAPGLTRAVQAARKDDALAAALVPAEKFLA